MKATTTNNSETLGQIAIKATTSAGPQEAALCGHRDDVVLS